MRVVPFKKQPFFPSSIWVSPIGQRVTQVEGAIERPDGPAEFVTNLKQWAMEPEARSKTLGFGGDALKARKINNERALRLLFEDIALHAEFVDTSRPIWLLLPAIAESATHRDYKRLMGRAIRHSVNKEAHIGFLFEPEMTLEYFRLVRRELTLAGDENNFFLIIDCGALTCNMTIAISNRDQTITKGTTGRDRSALRSVSSGSVLGAGRLIDDQLWQEACAKLDLDFESNRNREYIAELAKLEVAHSNRPCVLYTPEGKRWTLTPDRLLSATRTLWSRYSDQLDELLNKTFKQLSSSKTHSDSLAERNIKDGRSLARSLRAVILAGGSSQLPGFANELRTHLRLPDTVQLFSVGAEYPVAASVGAMAHILDRKRLLLLPDTGDEDEEPSQLYNTLQDDIYLAWRERDASADIRLRYELLIKREDWPEEYADVQERSFEEWSDKTIEYSLVWGPDGAENADFVGGRGSRRWTTLRAKPRTRKVRVRSIDGGDTLTVQFVPYSSRFPQRYYLSLPRGVAQPTAYIHESADTRQRSLRVEATDDIVIDFGMSKTVVVVADRAADLDPSDFEVARPTDERRTLPGGWSLKSGGSDREICIASSTAADAASVTAPSRESNEGHASASPKTPGPDALVREVPAQADGAPDSSSELVFLQKVLAYAETIGLNLKPPDMVFLHLAAKVRPLILFAGPSGAGKTTIARFYANALGCPRDLFCKVPVQAHWTDDSKFLNEKGAVQNLLTRVRESEESMGLVLFDELNLTRPEYYLSRWTHAIDDDSGNDPGGILSLPRTRAGTLRVLTMGTMNIDEWSRPPPDKLLDRAFLIELHANLPDSRRFTDLSWRESPVEVSAHVWQQWCNHDDPLELPAEVHSLFGLLNLHCEKHGYSIHETLQPSRRALRDTCRILSYWRQVPGVDELLTRAELLDRVVASRILPKFRGSAPAMNALLAALRSTFVDQGWDRSRRHVEVMARQLESGFASFWG